MSKPFDLVLKVTPAANIPVVVDWIYGSRNEIKEEYDKQLADNYGVEGSIEILDVIARPRSVVVQVSGPDIRLNALSRAIARVVGMPSVIRYPQWG